MRATEALAELGSLRKPVITTAEAAALWSKDLSSASKTLSRLATSSLIQHVRQGIWAIGTAAPDTFEVAPVLTRPYPNYVSMYSALFKHGMIDQIPRTIDLMSLGRPMKIETSVGLFTIHKIQRDSFGGFVGEKEFRSGLATAEKALVDTVCVLSVRGAFVTLPEIELTSDFDFQSMWSWAERISSVRLRTIATTNLKRIVEPAIAN